MFEHKKYFGLLSLGPIIFIVFVVSTYGFNLTYNSYSVNALYPHDQSFDYISARNKLLIVNFISSIVIFIGFLLLTVIQYSKNDKLIRILFPFALIGLQFFFNSTLFDLMEKEDNYSYNSDIGIVWIIIWPASILIMLIFSFLFDMLKNWRFKKIITAHNNGEHP